MLMSSKRSLPQSIWDHCLKSDFEFNDKDINVIASNTQYMAHTSWTFSKLCPEATDFSEEWMWVCVLWVAAWESKRQVQGGGAGRGNCCGASHAAPSQREAVKGTSLIQTTTGVQEKSSDGGEQFLDGPFCFPQVIQHKLHLTFDNSISWKRQNERLGRWPSW